MSSTTSTTTTSLTASVTSLQSSLHHLDNSISILSAGTRDFPRLSHILSSTRHFELTPSTSLTAAQRSLAAELSPAIATLLARAEGHVERLERREQALMARAELQAGRLGQAAGHGHGYGKAEGGERLGEGEKGENARLRALRLRRERLAYVVERLGLQSQQRERQLRRSVSRAGMDFR